MSEEAVPPPYEDPESPYHASPTFTCSISPAQHPDLLWDVDRSSTDPGTNVILWKELPGKKNQKFLIEYLEGDDSYVIRPMHCQDKCLEILEGKTSSGAKLVLGSWVKADHQKFLLERSSGTVRIRAKHSGLVISVSGSSLIQDTESDDKKVNFVLRLNSVKELEEKAAVLDSKESSDLESDCSLLGPEWDGAVVYVWSEYSRKVWDIDNKSTSSGALLTYTNLHEENSQKFKLLLQDDGSSFSIQCHAGAGFFLEVRKNSMSPGAVIIQWGRHKSDRQKFFILRHTDGSISFKSKSSGLILEPFYGRTLLNTSIVQNIWSGSSQQRFRLRIIQEPKKSIVASADLSEKRILLNSDDWHGKIVTVTTVLFEKVWDIAGISVDNGATLTLWDAHGKDNQRFKLEMFKDGTWKITAVHSSKVLDVSGGKWGGSTEIGAKIFQWTFHGRANQRFYIHQFPDGTVAFESLQSGYFLEPSYGSGESGTWIVQSRKTGKASQRFQLSIA